MLTLHVSGGTNEFIESLEAFGFGVDSMIKYDVNDAMKSVSACYALVVVIGDDIASLAQQYFDIGVAVSHGRQVFIVDTYMHRVETFKPELKNITVCKTLQELQEKLVCSLISKLDFKSTPTSTVTDEANEVK